MSSDPAVLPGVDRWFGVVDLRGAPDSAVRVIRELIRMLDRAAPRLLDRGRSRIQAQGHGRTRAAGWVEIVLVHRTEPEFDIEVAVDIHDASVSWLGAHEHVYEDEAPAGRLWTSVVVDLTHSVLRGEYEVEQHYRGRRLVRTKIIDTAEPAGQQLVSEEGPLLTAWIPWPRVSRVERRRVQFDVQH